MICTNCGNEVPDTAKVCGFCGHRLKAAPAPSPVETHPQEPTSPSLPSSLPPTTKTHQEPRGDIPGWVWGWVLIFAIGIGILFIIRQAIPWYGNLRKSQPETTMETVVELEPVETPILEVAPVPTSSKIPPSPTEELGPLYDNFDNSAFDGGININQWVKQLDSAGTFAQQNGILVVSKKDAGSIVRLTAKHYSDFQLNVPINFEAKLMLDPEEHVGGNVQLHLFADLAGTSTWYSECNIRHSKNSANASCKDQIYPKKDGHFYITEETSVDYGDWHKFRIEVNPTTMTFTYYMNDQMIGSHIPVDAEELKTAEFSLMIGVWAGYSDTVTGYIDDVQVWK